MKRENEQNQGCMKERERTKHTAVHVLVNKVSLFGYQQY
jgi:hypothetical protein